MFQEALTAIQADDLARARDLLTRLIKRNPRNAAYWLWMSAVVDSLRERKYCLKQAYRLDPDNKAIQQGLILLGELPVDQELVILPKTLHQNWQKELRKDYLTRFKPPGLKDFFTWQRLLIGVGAVALVVALGAVGLLSPLLRNGRRNTPAPIVLATFRPPAALQETLAASPTVLTPTQAGPTPLWMLLEETLTPTPLYVATPHPRTEAFKSGLRAYEAQAWDDMLTYMEQAAQVEPDAPDIHYYIGEAYRNKQYTMPAIKAYNQALTKDGNFAPAYLGLGKTYLYNMEQWENARDNFKLAVKNDPQILEAYLELAHLALEQSNGQLALDWITQAEDARLSSPFLPLYRAQALLLLEQPEEALAAALTANQQDPTHLDSYRVLGQAYLAAAQIGEAVETLNIYLAHAPEDGEATAWLGLAYEERGQTQRALDTYTQAIQLGTRQPAAYLNRGLIYFAQGKNEEAKTDLQKSLELDKTSFVAHMTLGQVHLLLEEDGNAYQQFSVCEAYAESDEDWAQIYYWRAQALENLGQTDVARNNWSNLLKLPAASVPEDWQLLAEQRLGRTRTPTLTPTRTITPTLTRTPTRTITATQTRQPTNSATPKP